MKEQQVENLTPFKNASKICCKSLLTICYFLCLGGDWFDPQLEMERMLAAAPAVPTAPPATATATPGVGLGTGREIPRTQFLPQIKIISYYLAKSSSSYWRTNARQIFKYDC